MRLPEPHTYYVHSSLGAIEVARALTEAGERVEAHGAHFTGDADDDVWLDKVGQSGWAALTKDDTLRHNIVALAAIHRSRVALFTLSSGSMRGADMAALFAAALPQMRRLLRENEPPFVARVSRRGAEVISSADAIAAKLRERGLDVG